MREAGRGIEGSRGQRQVALAVIFSSSSCDRDGEMKMNGVG